LEPNRRKESDHTYGIAGYCNADEGRRKRQDCFTASRVVGELAEDEGGPPGGGGAALELEEGRVVVLVTAPVLLGVRAEVGEAVSEDEEEGLGDGDEREEDRAETLHQRQRALRLLLPSNQRRDLYLRRGKKRKPTPEGRSRGAKQPTTSPEERARRKRESMAFTQVPDDPAFSSNTAGSRKPERFRQCSSRRARPVPVALLFAFCWKSRGGFLGLLK
jgi:hypothetical protein